MEHQGVNMVHIKNDLRAKKSAELIRAGLIRCLRRKSFAELTVSELIEEAGVGRTTFYRLFDNICDVLYYECDLLAEKLVKSYREQTDNPDFLRFSLAYWLEHHLSLEAVFASNRADILQDAMLKYADYLIPAFALENTAAWEMDYLLAIATALLSSILMVWVRHGKTETVDEIYQIYTDTMVTMTGRKGLV